MSRPNDRTRAVPMLLALLFATSVASAAERYERNAISTFTYSGGRVMIEHTLGDVRIRTTSDSTVTVKAVVRASDRDLGERIRIITSGGTHGVSVRTEYPQSSNSLGDMHSYSVDYDITVPERAPVTVRSRFGNIDVAGLRVASEFTNSMGSVRLEHASGIQTIDNSFGAVHVRSISGGVIVRGTNGAVSVTDGGNVEVTSRFSSVNVDESRTVVITNTNGSVRVRNSATVALTSTFGTSDIDDVRGDVEITTRNGRVAVSDVTGHTRINGAFGPIDVTNAGAVAITSSNGQVRVTHARGAVNINSTFDHIDIHDVSGGARVTNRQGEVIATDVHGELTIDTRGGQLMPEPRTVRRPARTPRP